MPKTRRRAPIKASQLLMARDDDSGYLRLAIEEARIGMSTPRWRRGGRVLVKVGKSPSRFSMRSACFPNRSSFHQGDSFLAQKDQWMNCVKARCAGGRAGTTSEQSDQCRWFTGIGIVNNLGQDGDGLIPTLNRTIDSRLDRTAIRASKCDPPAIRSAPIAFDHQAKSIIEPSEAASILANWRTTGLSYTLAAFTPTSELRECYRLHPMAGGSTWRTIARN
jgi:hypothetical protein